MHPKRNPRSAMIVVCSVLAVVLAGACASAGLLLCGLLYGHFTEAASTRERSADATFKSPLESVHFPDQRIDYPENWPPEFRYPETVVLVEARSGPTVGEQASGWVMKHRCPGTPNETADLLTSWMSGNGWAVVERLALESDKLVLLVEGAGGGSGIVNIGVDPSRGGSSLVASTFIRR